MSTIALSSPLGPRWTPGHWGSTDSVGIRAHHAAGLSIVEVGALPDTAADLRTALNAAFSIDLGAGTPAESAENAVCTGPGKYLLTGTTLQTVQAAIGALGLAVDQSSGRVKLSIDGPAVAGLLAKACPINLADWPVGAAHASHFMHIACAYYRRAEDGFDLYVGRSFAQSTAEWLLDAGAEFGVEIV
jgi:sarcosine oxidase subunit gamma